MKLDSTLLFIVSATVINGMMAFTGGVALLISEKKLYKVIRYLISFSAGVLFAGAVFHLMSESIEEIGNFTTNILLYTGFLSFFIFERYLWWHHCHNGGCKTHPVSYLILAGDGLHNLIDGMVIAAAFLTDIKLGILTTILILVHELPQELGDFAVLVHAGWKPEKALFYNFLSQLTAVIGGLLAYLSIKVVDYSPYLLGFAAGGFIYIAASDLIPQIHKHSEEGKATVFISIFLLGSLIMIYLKFLGE